MAQIEYINGSHKRIIEAIMSENKCLRKPIMLTANQYDKVYTVSLGWTNTSITIPKEDLVKEEVLAITNEDYGGRIVLNDVWEAKF